MVTKEELKAKAKEAKDTVKFKAHCAGIWIENHTQEIAVMTPIAVAGLGLASKVTKNATTRANIAHETKRREKTVYDPSTGCYLDLKRKLRADEKIALAKRPEGMTVTEVLDTLHLIK